MRYLSPISGGIPHYPGLSSTILCSTIQHPLSSLSHEEVPKSAGLLDNLVFGHRWEKDAEKNMDVKIQENMELKAGKYGRTYHGI